MGFAPAPTEPSFAERSAHYLANHGYRSAEIAQALIEELNVSTAAASQIATAIAA